MPLLLEALPPGRAARLARTLRSREHFWTQFPVPSVSVSEPSFTVSPGALLDTFSGPVVGVLQSDPTAQVPRKYTDFTRVTVYSRDTD